MLYLLAFRLYFAASMNNNTCPSFCYTVDYCSSLCAIPECNYDSWIDFIDKLGNFMYAPCFPVCHCDILSLGDGICDPECDMYQCGYDLGDCGHCSSGCFVEDLESNTCKSECFNQECSYYNSNPCNSFCNLGCSIEKDLYRNGSCKLECISEGCIYYYNNTCSTLECAPGCYFSDLANNQCDPSCYNAECYYDYGSCDCSKDCRDTSGKCETNETYTDPCDTKSCRYKEGKCGYCAPGCFEDLLGDRVCQPQCNTEDCNYDYGDCGCTPKCSYRYENSSSKYIQTGSSDECSPYCLVDSCRFGINFCPDTTLVKIAVLNNIIKPVRDFQVSYCEYWGCTRDEIYSYLNDTNYCDEYSLCNTDICLFCMGRANAYFENCFKQKFENCLVCDEMIDNTCHSNLNECPKNYENVTDLANLFGNKLWCMKSALRYSPNNYKEIFVNSSFDSLGDGTNQYPFNSLYYALADIYALFTKLYLVNKEIDFFIDSSLSNTLFDKYQPLYKEESFNYDQISEIWLIGYYSDTGKTKVYWKDNLRISTSAKKFFIKNIEFIGKYVLMNNCDRETCYYCPYVKYENGSYYDDSSIKINESDYLEYYSKNCSNYSNVDIFTVANEFYLENVDFQDFRYQFSSLFLVYGILSLKNVNFMKIQPNEFGSLIYLWCFQYCQFDICTNKCENTRLNYSQGLVYGIGAGYNNIVNVSTGNFIRNFGSRNIFIANVTFEYNFAFRSLNKEDDSSLIYSQGHYGSVKIEDCKFNANFLNYLVVIDVESLNYNHFTLDEFIMLRTQQHFLMNNITISNTYCSNGILKYSMKSYTQNIKIANIKIKHSVIGKEGIFTFKFKGKIEDSEFNGSENYFSSDVYIHPRSLIIENIIVETSVTGKNVLYIENYPTTIMKNIVIFRIMDGHFNGNNISELYDIINLFSKNRETSHFVYMNDENPEVGCKEMVLATKLGVLFIDSLSISKISCINQASPAGLSISSVSTSSISKYSFTDVKSDSKFGSALTIIDSDNIIITDIEIDNITNTLESIILFDGCVSISINSANISDIFTNYQSPFVVSNSDNFYMSNFLISTISSLTDHGGCFLLKSENTGSFYQIKSGSFSKCSSINAKGGAICLNMTSNKVDTSLQLVDVEISNIYSDEGSAIFISEHVKFKETIESKFVRLLIENNDCKIGGVISDYHYSGKLAIDGLEMKSNLRGIYVVLTDDDSELHILNSKVYASTILSSVFYLKSSKPNILFNFHNVEIFNAKVTAIEAINIKLIMNQTTVYNAYQAISLNENVVCQGNGLTISNSLIKGINLENNSTFYCNNCEFTLNKNYIIFVKKNSKFTLENCKIFENQLKHGYFIYIFSEFEEECSLISSSIYSNSLTSGSLIYISSSILALKSSNIIENYGFSTDINSITIFKGKLNIYDSKFQFKSLVENGAFLYALSDSNITAQNSVFENSISNYGGIYGIFSDIFINNCTFSGNKGGDINTLKSILKIYNSYFENSQVSLLNSATIALKSNFNTELKDSVFKNISSNIKSTLLAYVYDELSDQLVILKCTFLGSSYLIGAVSLKQSISVFIQDSHFSGFNTGDYSVLNAFSFSVGHTLSIENSTITHNKCIKNGGGVNSESFNLIINNVEFSFNTALDSGGGIYFSSENCFDCGLFLLGSTKFMNNSCNYDGGAIKWNHFKPFIEDSILFLNNSAKYGADLASNPVKFKFLVKDGSLDDFFNLSNVPPGKKVTDIIQVLILDIYDQHVLTENSLKATLMPNDANFSVFSVSGKTNFQANEGVLNISEFIISGKQNSFASLKLRTDDFSRYLIRNYQLNYSDSVYINAQLRNCTKGEEIQASACIDCEKNKYSLEATKNCLSCPTGATCLGKSSIIVDNGYWRSSLESDVVYPCDVFDACLKGTEINELGNCSTGYTGVICKSCEVGYSKTVNGICTKCPNKKANIVIMLFICLGIALLSFTLVKTTLQSSFSTKSLHSIYIKIFTNYLQLIFIVTQLDLEWPSYLLQFLNIQRTTSSASDQLFSFDCYLSLKNPDEIENVYYTKMCMISALPIVTLVISYSFWIFYGSFMDSYKYLKREAFTTIIVLFFLVYPTIVKFMFSNFSCLEIDKMKSYINENTSVECWSLSYKKYSFIVVVPSIIIWALGSPAILLMLLIKNKRRLHLDFYRVVFGFLYNGYRQSMFYWEFVIMLRKIIMITIIVLKMSQARVPQALNLILTLLISIYLHHNFKPYNSVELNKMEMQALNISAITTYFGLYYQSKSIGDSIQILLFILIIFGNGYFLMFWIYYMFSALVDIFIKFFPRYRSLFSKGDTFNEEFHCEEITRKGVIFNELEKENTYTFINLDKPIEDEILKYKNMDEVYIDVAKRDIKIQKR